MRIVLYQSWDELQSLAASWDALLAASSSDTVFLTWEWCEAWWKNYGAGRPLFVLAAWEGSELTGIAPFYVGKARYWGTTWACLRIIGDGSNDSDYMDCFARSGSEREVVHAFVKYLGDCRSSWDWLEITCVPQNSPCLAALVECADQRGWKSACAPIPCASLPLPMQWDKYLKELPPRFRTKIRSSLTLLKQHLGSIPRECSRAEEINAWLADLFDLHARRWEQSHGPGVFRDPAKRAFYHDLSRSTLRRGWLAFHRLDWGERPLALQYGFRYRNRFYLLQEGYDPAFEALHPGITLRAWLMRYWIEQGLEEYDFLAGTAPHKMSWGAKEKVSVRLLLAASRRGEWVAMGAPRASQELKQSVANVVPPQLFAWRKELLARRAQRRFNGSDKVTTGLSARVVRQIASHLYSWTPVGSMSRKLATRYTWNAGNHLVSRRRVPSFQIFIYHRVNDDRDSFLYAMPVSQFRSQMEYLARNFQVITLDQIAKGTFAQHGQKHCVAITLDDGYRDNFLYAFPVLKDLGISATVFLATGYIDSGELPWYDQVCLAFKLTVQPRLAIPQIGDFSWQTQASRLEALQRTLAALRSVNETTRFQLLRELHRQLRVPASLTLPNAMLSWDEIRRMSKQGISFGAHTVTHPVLASLPGARLEEEILGSKKTVENHLQLAARHFAYPFGKPFDVGAEAKRVVKAAGFETAVTTVYGVNDPTQDFFELKRFCLVEPDSGMFSLKLDWNRMAESSGEEQYHEEKRTV